MKKNFILLLSFVTFTALSALSQDLPEKQNPPHLVNDFADFLTDDEERNLENKLVSFNDSTSTQITIVSVQNTGGQDKAMYAALLGEKWGVGQKGISNGVLILLVREPKGIFIATGRGVEEYVTDLIAARIIDDNIKPNFKKNNFYQGLDEATEIIIGLTTGKYDASQFKKKKKGSC